jgi:hypothetical protein
MPFNWNGLGNDILGGLEDTGNKIADSFNPLNTVGALGGDAQSIVHDTTGLGGQIVSTGGNLVGKGLDTISSLTNMIPYILVGGVVLMVLNSK